MKTVALKVMGKVQGVFYRKSTKQKAQELGITGYVRNEDDGSVYIIASGSSAQLQEFISWCQQGPSGARVSSIESAEQPYQSFSSFSIER